jgi:hypothetical protein
MQPYVNLGINFRKHFERLGVSVKRSERAIWGRMRELKKDIKEGIVDREYAKERLKELQKLYNELRKRT